MCDQNLRQIGGALHGYHSGWDSFPYGAVSSTTLPVGKRLSWLVSLLDFIEGNAPNIPDKTRAWDESGSFHSRP